MAAPERKYTDADVRGDPELAELALDYLDNYTGAGGGRIAAPGDWHVREQRLIPRLWIPNRG